ncbi:MAG: MATE family efflux transporter [Lachnospiraceae bacterium]|nr:MATE family efflux transporter [Lachnospiraceae bacterium]
MMLAVLVLQNVITLSVNLADNIMLGGYNETALSGVAAVNQIQFLYQQLLTALGEGIVILGSQYFGRGSVKPVKEIASGAMHLALILCLALFMAMSFFPHSILQIFTPDEAIIAQGLRYIRIIRFTYPFFAVTMILLATLRSTGTVKIALVLSVTALVINCCINYTLIYGHFGAPEMGAAGAAVGTLVSRITETLILVLFIAKKEKTLSLRVRDFLVRNRELLGDYVKVTWPVFLVQGLWGANIGIQSAILGHMSSQAIAANSVSTTFYSVVKAIPVGACGAASFVVGKTVGEGDENRIMEVARTLQVIFVLMGIVCGLILFAIKGPLLSLYNLEPETRALTDQFLGILCVIVVTMSYQMPTNNGIVRGGGDTKFTMKLDLISIWMIVLPLSYVMAFVVKAPPAVVVCCLNADQVFKCVPAFLKANFGHWARKLTR